MAALFRSLGWERAVAGGTTTSLRAYRHEHPMGRHRQAAIEKLEAIVDETLDRLAGRRLSGPAGRHGMLYLLVDHIKEKRLYLEPFPVRVDYTATFQSMTGSFASTFRSSRLSRQSPPFRTKRIERAKGASPRP